MSSLIEQITAEWKLHNGESQLPKWLISSLTRIEAEARKAEHLKSHEQESLTEKQAKVLIDIAKQAGADAKQAEIVKIINEYGSDSTGTVGAVLETIKPELLKLIKSQPQKAE